MRTMTDAELEARLRTTLRTVAEHTAVHDPLRYQEATKAPPRRRTWTLVAAAAALVAAVAGGVALAGDDDGSTPLATTPPVTVPGPPAVLGGPIFTAEGEAAAVAEAYLRDRFTDFPAPRMQVGAAQVEGARATVPWANEIGDGTVSLVRRDGGWTVTSADTSEVQVTGPTLENGRLRARFGTTDENRLVVDVLDTDGATLFRAAGPSYDIDLPEIHEPVILRAQLIGGTTLSITELWVRPESEPGQEVAGGAWEGGAWAALRSERCAWLDLEVVSVGRTCDYQPVTAVFTTFGPVSRVGAETLYWGIVGPQVATVRALLADGQVVDHTPVDGLIVVTVPSTGDGEVAFVDAAGQELDRLPLVPAGPVGG